VLFRVAGTLIIVSSLAIPFLAASTSEQLRTYGVPIASLLVAILASLNAFFQWQAVWQKRLTIELTLEGWIAVWNTKIAEAYHQDDLKRSYQMALEATQDLIEKTRTIQVTETALLFSRTKPPLSTSDGKPA
jgi:hypothetical protein